MTQSKCRSVGRRHVWKCNGALFLVVLFCLAGDGLAQTAIERRLDRIEAKLDSLLALHRSQQDSQNPQALLPDSMLRDSGNLFWGVAGPTGTLLDKRFFLINYNQSWKIPYWVAYHLSVVDLTDNAPRRDDFRPDPELATNLRAELADYRGSGFDRGHNAPAADFKRSAEAMSTTFLLSNMSPQTPALNQRIWAQLEGDVRELVRTEGDAWVITGNIFMRADSTLSAPSETIGAGQVAVPTHCFKTVLTRSHTGVFHIAAFLMPNQRDRIPGGVADYILSVDRLEQIDVFNFYPALPDDIEADLERRIDDSWIN